MFKFVNSCLNRGDMIQNFVDLDACKQLFVLNSYKSAIKKPEVKKIKNK